MSRRFQVIGELTDPQHVRLDVPVPLAAGKVRVVLEQFSERPKLGLAEFEAGLRERQAARGHVPRTVAEISAYLDAERASWGS